MLDHSFRVTAVRIDISYSNDFGNGYWPPLPFLRGGRNTLLAARSFSYIPPRVMFRSCLDHPISPPGELRFRLYPYSQGKGRTEDWYEM